MKLLKKELIVKKTIGRALIESVISALILSVFVYLFLGEISSGMVVLLNSIIEGKISAFNMTLILFPIILIVSLILNLAMLVSSYEKK